jgi:transposase InsO family protein
MSRAGCGTRRLLRLGVAPAVAADAGGRLSRRTGPPDPWPQPGHLWRATRACRAPPRLGRPCQPQTGRPADARPWPGGRPPPPAARLHTPRPDRHTSAGPGRTELPAARTGPAGVADITQQRTDQGWLYLAVILDAFSRRVVGWSMAEHLRTELVLDALEMAISQRQPAPGLVCHSDHGCQYTSFAYGRRLAASEFVASRGPSATPWTTPSPRASSPPWNASSSTATPGRPERAYGRRSSTSSRSSTTANAATRLSTTIHPPPTSTTTHQQHLRPNHRVHGTGATPIEPTRVPIAQHTVGHSGASIGPRGDRPTRPEIDIVRVSNDN